MRYTYDIFLSFSSYDSILVRPFIEYLTVNEMNVFFLEATTIGESSVCSSVQDAMRNSKYYVFICSYDFLRRFRNSLCHCNELEQPMSHVLSEIKESQYFAKTNGLQIIPVVIARPHEQASVKDLLRVFFGKGTMYIVGSLEYAQKAVVCEIRQREKRQTMQLYADELFACQVYEKAKNKYLELVKISNGEMQRNAYKKAAECALYLGEDDEATRLFAEAHIEDIPSITQSQRLTLTRNNNDEVYINIVKYCDASIDLFQSMLGSAMSEEALNCLRANYKRLINYCKTVGGMEQYIDIILQKMENIEYIKVKKTLNENDIDYDRKIKSYRNYLGLDFPEADNYDVFISYKSEDEALARRVFEFLIGAGKRVFFAREALPVMGKTEYREAIMDALDHSQHFILVTSNLAYIKSNWVKEEWSFFISKLIESAHKGNFALIVYDDCNVTPEALPPNLRYKQRFYMSNFKDCLLPYLEQ